MFTVYLTKFPIVKFAKWELKKKENWNTVQQFKNCTCIKKMSTFSASFKSDHIRILFWFILWKETYDVYPLSLNVLVIEFCLISILFSISRVFQLSYGSSRRVWCHFMDNLCNSIISWQMRQVCRVRQFNRLYLPFTLSSV